MISISEAFFLIWHQMSIANIVQLLLNMEVNDDIRAANITANIKPLAPAKIKALNALMEMEFYIEWAKVGVYPR